MSGPASSTKLTLGPVLFNWDADTWRDFYFRIADEAPVDTVYLGEVVCSKREPFFLHHMETVSARLAAAGKEVAFSTLALVMKKRELQGVRGLIEGHDLLIEANDTSALAHLSGRPHVVGPYVNVYNEATMHHLARQGAKRICLPFELEDSSVKALAAAAPEGPELEVQIFGRTPLALSARCYHARAHNLHKDNCQFICEQDPDGRDLSTMDGQPFLAINGIQTMSHMCLERAEYMPSLIEMGVTGFRLSPHTCDMVDVAEAYRGLIEGRYEPDLIRDKLMAIAPDLPMTSTFHVPGSAPQTIRHAI